MAIILSRNPNIADMVISPTFYYKVNGNINTRCRRTNNSWTDFWNLTGARNKSNLGHLCDKCGRKYRKWGKTHQLPYCTRCVKHVLAEKRRMIICST